MRIPQLIRIKHIIDLLNDCEYHKNQEIIDYLDDKLDICYNASTIEKDIALIKREFLGKAFVSGKVGIKIDAPIDFWETLKAWLS